MSTILNPRVRVETLPDGSQWHGQWMWEAAILWFPGEDGNSV